MGVEEEEEEDRYYWSICCNCYMEHLMYKYTIP
jgi:hypothetical protein